MEAVPCNGSGICYCLHWNGYRIEILTDWDCGSRTRGQDPSINRKSMTRYSSSKLVNPISSLRRTISLLVTIRNSPNRECSIEDLTSTLAITVTEDSDLGRRESDRILASLSRRSLLLSVYRDNGNRRVVNALSAMRVTIIDSLRGVGLASFNRKKPILDDASCCSEFRRISWKNRRKIARRTLRLIACRTIEALANRSSRTLEQERTGLSTPVESA